MRHNPVRAKGRVNATGAKASPDRINAPNDKQSGRLIALCRSRDFINPNNDKKKNSVLKGYDKAAVHAMVSAWTGWMPNNKAHNVPVLTFLVRFWASANTTAVAARCSNRLTR